MIRGAQTRPQPPCQHAQSSHLISISTEQLASAQFHSNPQHKQHWYFTSTAQRKGEDETREREGGKQGEIRSLIYKKACPCDNSCPTCTIKCSNSQANIIASQCVSCASLFSYITLYTHAIYSYVYNILIEIWNLRLCKNLNWFYLINSPKHRFFLSL